MILTENAGVDNLTNEDYKDICDDIRNYDESQAGKRKVLCKDVLSWDKFILQIGSFRFKAQWANWRVGKANLQWDMKNDLRRAAGLPELPEPVQQVLEGHVHENAKIVVHGSELKGGKWAKYVQLSETEPAGITTEKATEIISIVAAPLLLPEETKPKRKKRVGFMRPSVPTKYDEKRKKLGKSWEQVIQAGLISIERGDVDGKQGKGGRLNV